MKKIVDMFERARMTEHPVISVGDFNYNYILDETLSTNPILDMKHLDKESFSNDLISCDILNGSQDNDDVS